MELQCARRNFFIASTIYLFRLPFLRLKVSYLFWVLMRLILMFIFCFQAIAVGVAPNNFNVFFDYKVIVREFEPFLNFLVLDLNAVTSAFSHLP